MAVYDKYYLKKKEKPQYVKKKENTGCLVCKKKTDNKNRKGIALENKVRQQKSMRVDCDSKKSTFLKPIKPIKNKKQFLQMSKHAILL